ncbi:hypothetical protein L2750_01390 [Shewanella submarina]|uniref:DUF5666 domain-containing protein n=1 Tax=Shewanella submarina TaxID=2016376 RepID=A0ABV7GL21_9GAMM|nr:hypothetical protein [Shewanella submarina]MCL1035812.1 hypothetical protein [Shewanella submarina]
MRAKILKLLGLPALTLAGAVMAQPQELSEHELGAIRGKYTVSGQDYYFGLLMQTRYIQPDGQVRQADMQVEISAASGMQVTVSDAVTATSESAQFELLGQQSGLQQRIQIAGSSNRAFNDMSLAEGTLTPLENGVVVAIGQQWVSSQGDVLFSTQTGQLGMQINLPSGAAVQGILNQSGNGQLLQSIDIHGGAQAISNLSDLRYAGIDIGTIPTGVLAQQLLGLNH